MTEYEQTHESKLYKNFLKYIIIILSVFVTCVNAFIIADLFSDFWIIAIIFGISIGTALALIKYYKRKRLYILIDTIHLQEQFEANFDSSAVNNGKFSREYKQWLKKIHEKPSLFTSINQNPNLYLQQGRNKHILVNSNVKFDWYCFFVISFFLPMIFGLIYVSIIYWFIFIPVFSLILLALISSRKKNSGQLVNYLDSEVKRELYKIETGYQPFSEKKKASFKYKKWLISKEFS